MGYGCQTCGFESQSPPMKPHLIKTGDLNIKWSETEEVGGIILGHHYGEDDTDYTVTRFVQLKNTATMKSFFYRLPGKWNVILKIAWYLIKGEQILGEWHSHTTGTKHPTQSDERAIAGKVWLHGKYLLGIVSRDEVRIYRYEFTEKQNKKGGKQ